MSSSATLLLCRRQSACCKSTTNETEAMSYSASQLHVAKRIVDLVAGLSAIATMIFIFLQWNEMR